MSVERAKLAEQAERYEDMAKVRTWETGSVFLLWSEFHE